MSATPILDLEQDPPKPSWGWLPKLTAIGIGLFIAAIWISAEQEKLLGPWPPFNWRLFIPAFYAAVAFHEIGHLVAGKLVGIEAGGISVGGFALTKSGKSWGLRFDRRTLFSGFFKPLTSAVDFQPFRYGWLVAGGPLASIALSVLSELVYVEYGAGAGGWIGTLFWTSLFIAVTTAIPSSAGLNKSDGARLVQIILYPDRAWSWIALLAIQTENGNGLRPREWSPKPFEQILTVDPSAGEYLYCQLLAYNRRLDEGEEDGALEHLENLLAGSARAGSVRQPLFLEAASASAMTRKNAAHARIWRDRACKVRKPESFDAVDAAIAMCEGRFEQAAQHWEAARAHLARKKLDSGQIRFITERWDNYEADCRSLAHAARLPALHPSG